MHPPAAIDPSWRSLLLRFRGPLAPKAAIDFFVPKLVVRFSSTSAWRSLLLGFRGHPPVAIDFSVAKLVVGCSGAPPVAIDLAVAKLVVGFSGAPPGCNRPLRGKACCWVFGGNPPAAIDFFVAKLVVGFSGVPPGCNRLLRGRSLFVGLGKNSAVSWHIVYRSWSIGSLFLYLLSV